jgi:hypothetical protein
VSKTIGAAMIKKALSKIAVSITYAIDLPMVIPSLFNRNAANAVPPTTDGVTVEANSHKIII